MMKSSTNVACRGNPSVVNFVMHIEFVVQEINIKERIKLKNGLLKRIAIFTGILKLTQRGCKIYISISFKLIIHFINESRIYL